MSLVDDISGEQTEQLAVLYCDISRTDAATSAESEIGLWRVNYFRAAREMAADFGGQEATSAAEGWIATFDSTLDALVCARALSSLVGWQTGGPSLSGGLSAGEVVRDPFGIGGAPVREAVALCRSAQPRQVLVADPLKVIVARDSAQSFAPAAVATLDGADPVPPAAATAGRGGLDVSAPQPSAAGGSSAPTVRGGAGIPGPRGEGHQRYDRWGASGRLEHEDRATPPSLRLLKTGPSTSPPAAAGRGPLTKTPAITRPAPAPTARTGAATGAATTRAATTPEARTGAATTGAPAFAGGAIRLTVLGWVQLEAGEPAARRAVLRGSQARAVLSMLALRRGPVHKDELSELVWPNGLPGHWDGALRGIITKIRRFLEAGGLSARDVLVGDGGYYELRLPTEVTVDRDLATTLIASAETALATNRPDEAAPLAQRAATILQRRLLSGPDNAWFDQFRSELATERLTALELFAQADLAAGGVEGAKRAATEALALDRYRESSYRLLMQAYAAAGSRGEALRTYEQCRRMLADELGVGPAAQTQALYIDLLG